MDRELLVQTLRRLGAPLNRRDAVREDEDIDSRLRREKSLRKILGGGGGTAIDALKRVRPAAPDPLKICEELLRTLLVLPTFSPDGGKGHLEVPSWNT